ncbi:hypothetical protein T492DRAFT_849355 [Pavlovales sp. CCMP2436]|nr:hypothetical protein T492DRAFT_849355 [Pavlovales sp. CCMP2436]
MAGESQSLGAHSTKLKLRHRDAPVIEAEGVLAAALAPCSVKDFLARYWRREALAIVPDTVPRGGDASARMQPIIDELFGLDLEALLAHTASERIFAWMCAREGEAAGDVAALRR